MTVLAGLGQVFARLARSSALSDTDGEALRKDIAQARVVLSGLEQQTHDIAKAALIGDPCESSVELVPASYGYIKTLLFGFVDWDRYILTEDEVLHDFLEVVHNIVLSMPAPTPPDKVLAAARTFARERFGLKYRYAMALHTHQEHPHVHIVVKAEGLDASRLHIDKAMLREWRHDFARMMRDQGIAANATPRAVRGRSKGGERHGRYRTKRRRTSHAHREKVEGVARELATSGTIRDPAHAKLAETRKAVVAGWLGVAALLDKQGEVALAGEIRQFVKNLAPVLTDRERLAAEFLRHVKAQKQARTQRDDLVVERTLERTR